MRQMVRVLKPTRANAARGCRMLALFDTCPLLTEPSRSLNKLSAAEAWREGCHEVPTGT